MPELPAFAYSDLPVHVAASVRGHTTEIKRLTVAIAHDIWKIGQHLAAAKSELVPHGLWLRWLRAEFKSSEDTAERWMMVYRNLGEIPQAAEFEKTALYLLADPETPTEAKTVAFQIAQNGEFVTHRRAKAIIVGVRETLKDRTLTPRQQVKVMSDLTEEIESAGTVSVSGVSVPADDVTIPLAVYEATTETKAVRTQQIKDHSQWEQSQAFKAVAGAHAAFAFREALESLSYGEPIRIVIYRKKENR